MHDFVAATLGGVLIGASALIILAGQGKIMGVSGIVACLLPPIASDWAWRIVFIAGVILTPIVARFAFDINPTVEITPNVLILAAGGAIVGFGTVIGNGCTSGHGVCGIARLSWRSVVATVIFMASAVISVALIKIISGG